MVLEGTKQMLAGQPQRQLQAMIAARQAANYERNMKLQQTQQAIAGFINAYMAQQDRAAAQQQRELEQERFEQQMRQRGEQFEKQYGLEERAQTLAEQKQQNDNAINLRKMALDENLGAAQIERMGAQMGLDEARVAQIQQSVETEKRLAPLREAAAQADVDLTNQQIAESKARVEALTLDREAKIAQWNQENEFQAQQLGLKEQELEQEGRLAAFAAAASSQEDRQKLVLDLTGKISNRADMYRKLGAGQTLEETQLSKLSLDPTKIKDPAFQEWALNYAKQLDQLQMDLNKAVSRGYDGEALTSIYINGYLPIENVSYVPAGDPKKGAVEATGPAPDFGPQQTSGGVSVPSLGMPSQSGGGSWQLGPVNQSAVEGQR